MNAFNIELNKYFKTNMFFLYLLISIVSFFIPILIHKNYNTELNPIYLYHDILNFNTYLTLPILTILYFTHFISHEYSKDTMKLVLTGIFTKEQIVLSKFFLATITFVLIMFITNVIVITGLYLSYGKLIVGIGDYGEYELFNLFDFILAFSVVNFFLYLYFIAWGSISILFSIIVKKRVAAIVLTLTFFIALKALPLPSMIRNYTFLDPTSVFVGLWDLKDSIYFLLQKGLSTFGFIVLFLFLSINIFRKYPNVRGEI